MYSSYRQTILSLAPKTQLKHHSVSHPAKGSHGEDLFTDYFYSEPQKKTLVHISGLHGAEGYFGSMVQAKILEDLATMTSLPFQIILVHSVNPYGMSWCRRTNNQNVDLNRNSLKIYEIPNPHYEKFAAFLNTNAGTESLWELLDVFIGLYRIGFRQMIQAVACGQTEFPNSVFYSGQSLQPELISLKSTLQSLIPDSNEISVIDVHTGLGGFARESLIIDEAESALDDPFVQNVFKTNSRIPGKSFGIYQAHGTLSNLFRNNWDPEKVHYVCQEFGTKSVIHVVRALIQDNFLHQWQPELTNEEKQQSQQLVSKKMLSAFFPEDPVWRKQCLDTAVLRFHQLISNM